MRGERLERGGGEGFVAQDLVGRVVVEINDGVEPLGVVAELDKLVVVLLKTYGTEQVQEERVLALLAARLELGVVDDPRVVDEHLADARGVVLAQALLEGFDVRAERRLRFRAERNVPLRRGPEGVRQLRGVGARAEQVRLVLGGEERRAHPVAPTRIFRGRVVPGRERRGGHGAGVVPRSGGLRRAAFVFVRTQII